MKIKNRIHLYTAVLFIVLLIVMNFTIYFIFQSITLEGEKEQAKEELNRVLTEFHQSLGTLPQGSLLRAYVPVDGFIRIIHENGEATTTTSMDNEKVDKLAFQFGASDKTEIIKNDHIVISSTPMILPSGEVANLQIGKDIEASYRNLNILKTVLFIVTLVATIPVFLSSRFVGNVIITPILSLTATMKEIRNSGQFKQLELHRNADIELREMGETFNHMITLLEENDEKQKQFIANASHELKTPLTIIESYANLLKRRGYQDKDLVDESVEAIHSEAIRMRELTEQLLLLAKNNEEWNVQKQEITLSPFLSEVSRSFERAYQRHITINGLKETTVTSDEQKLKQLLFILLDNARKYSENEIEIIIGKANEQTFIEVIDTGVGISKADQARVFDRFYQVDPARKRGKNGSGLGLSLAKEISEAIDVQLTLQSELGIGTKVKILFDKGQSQE
ncbi:ATP-binding protein [Cytobacillus sp. FSL W7-1323]|uniref:histidine kinase n=1 Tax=Cytobacillus kochii TaxID=859143 RepID=A0A248TGZ7_9BACI|nr:MULTISPECIES: ATP-binding protein [Cytobacillus]ASV67392.1 hypothetical protein CKF48_08665 [Cytobacillus kochii]MEA1854870.1 ATP-binding protein [Cytobacillus sp. OWB-43]